MAFRLDGHRYALDLSEVERVVRAVALTTVPNAPIGVLGLVDVQGRVMPVLDPRPHFGLAPRDVVPDDRLIIARSAGRAVALKVDAVDGVLGLSEHEVTSGAEIMPGLDLPGVAQTASEPAILLVDMAQLLRPMATPGAVTVGSFEAAASP